ncbi:MAG: YicC family protein [Oscillospiraceae bacterium]|nr:YicC family protein [Oscillospiraceae bacterium]
MIRSMTGYGSAKGDYAGLRFSIELKSVNNRFLDCNIRLPRGYLMLEETIKSEISSRISRGKVDVFLSVETAPGAAACVGVNEELALGYLNALRRIAELCSLPAPSSVNDIARYSDVLTVDSPELDPEELKKTICSITASAIDDFNAMREREGRKMAEDIEEKLCGIEALVSRVEEKSPETVAAYRERLYSKLREVLADTSIEEGRILQEAAVFADKVAVDEETVRLRSHIAQMRDMLKEGSPIGRKMDFLIQEFNREANTTGSKCNNSEISSVVIELKSEIEKIREQIQNIE